MQFIAEFYCFAQNKVGNFGVSTSQPGKSALYKSSAVTTDDGKGTQGGSRFDGISENRSFATYFFETKPMQFCLFLK